MLLQMALFHSSLWLSSIPLYICTTSFADGHVGCFYVLAALNNAAMNTRVQAIFSNYSLVWVYAQEWDC